MSKPIEASDDADQRPHDADTGARDDVQTERNTTKYDEEESGIERTRRSEGRKRGVVEHQGTATSQKGKPT